MEEKYILFVIHDSPSSPDDDDDDEDVQDDCDDDDDSGERMVRVAPSHGTTSW